ncbi:MAG: hypothetical protein FJ091_03140 [Deltaproteobacteria bacterium]|nr:hypothetical protein [Deltaproteobacteria bacterium]
MIEEALAAEGGVAYLRKQARENPQSFLALVGKLLPKDVRTKTDLPTVIFRDYTGLGAEVLKRVDAELKREKGSAPRA